MVKILSLFFLLMCSQAFASERPWTYVFWINGDFDYQGPVYGSDDVIELEDQPDLIYDKLTELAQADLHNNYIIFFDPKGRGKFYNKKHVKIDVYQKGEQLYKAGWRFKEIDATRPGAFQVVAQEGIKALGESWKESQKMFFFYGEHFPIKGEVDYDYTSYAQGFGLEKFQKGLQQFTKLVGRMDLLVMQTCYVNSLSFLNAATSFAHQILVPEQAILNTKMNFGPLLNFEGSRLDLGKKLQQANNTHPRYNWLQYRSEEVEPLWRLVEELKQNVDKEFFNQRFVRQEVKDYESFIFQVSSEATLLTSNEALLPFYDYYSLLERYQLQNFELLDQIDDHLDMYPKLKNLSEVLLELN